MAQDTLFYLFAAFTLMSALLMVVNRRPINSVIAMLLTVVGVSATLFLLDAPFLATLLLMIYAGAIVVLFLFVVMLIDSSVNPFKIGWVKSTVGAFVIFAILGAAAVWLFALSGTIDVAAPHTIHENLASVGQLPYSAGAATFGVVIFTRYVVAVEIIAMLLLGAMAGVLMLHAKREKSVPAGTPKAIDDLQK